jgi:hypothetical protein
VIRQLRSNTEHQTRPVAEWLLASAAVALLAGVMYWRTLIPGIGPTDSGELALAAWSLGVAHAPGMPGYILVGWVWTHLLSPGSVAWRASLLSAVSSAITAGLLTLASYLGSVSEPISKSCSGTCCTLLDARYTSTWSPFSG